LLNLALRRWGIRVGCEIVIFVNLIIEYERFTLGCFLVLLAPGDTNYS
jgi:hypothetical protein